MVDKNFAEEPIKLAKNNVTGAMFKFDAERVKTELKGFTVSEDGLKLMKGKELAAVLTPEGEVQLAEIPNNFGAIDNSGTEAAIELFGKNVPVELVSQNCIKAKNGGYVEETIDQFYVVFNQPLRLILAEFEDYLYDFKDGGSKLDISGVVTVKEGFAWKDGEYRVVWEKGAAAKGNEVLAPWYGVSNESIEWNLDNAKCNRDFDKNGTVVIPGNINEYGDYKEFKDKYELKIDNVNKIVTFQNNSGTPLSHELIINIKPTLKTKWATKLVDADKDYITIIVKPGSYAGR